MDRTILHCDLNAFYASVECVFNPYLKTVPMAVAGNPKHRHGIILAKNQLAKEAGVKTAETVWQADRKCPGLVLVPPRHDEYAKYSRLVNDIYQEFTDLVEPFGIDESWLDMTGVLHLFGDGRAMADRIRQTVKERLDLTLSVGVSFNKIFAKLGSDYKKPDATTVITRDNFKSMLWPLPVSRLLFVGKVTQKTLSGIGITTIGQLAALDKESLIALLGKTGGMLHDYANGIDESPVRSAYADQDLKSVGNGTTFDRDLVGFQEILSGIMPLCDEVATRMRKYGVKCQVISVQIKDPKFRNISRQKTLSAPTHLTREIADTAMELIRSAWNDKAPVRSITITGSNLVSSDQAVEQLSFFDELDTIDRQRYEKLDQTVDQIRQKFGKEAIGLGGRIKSEETP
ncbi:MAG: DNA polymerase IV [Saccharofermentanales bacterium]